MSPPHMKSKPTDHEPLIRDPDLLEQAVLANPYLKPVSRGEIRLLAVPSMLGRYMEQLARIFEAVGHPFSPTELDRLSDRLGARLDRAFREHPNSQVTLTYEPIDPPEGGLRCSFRSTSLPTDRNYETWIEKRQPPLFGARPDARVISVARGIAPGAKVLDVGAGTGRNALPLARLGHAVSAIEPTASFASQIRESARAEELPVTVMVGDAQAQGLPLEPGSFRLAIVVEVVTSHFRGVDQLRGLCSRMAELLAPGGLLLFDLFLTRGGYEPEPLVREMSQVVWSNLFTRAELMEALRGQPLKILSEAPEHDYEKANTPPEAWPPTGWYSTWAQGRNLFRVTNDGLPVELTWILCKRL